MASPLIVTLAAAAPALAFAAASLVSLFRRDRQSGGPALRLMCRGLGLSGAERRLLWRVAREARVRSAAALLVSRGCFEQAVGRAASTAARADRLAALRRRVFGAS